jgi:glycosidase
MSRILATFLICCFLGIQQVFPASVERVEPPFWWAGMKNPALQLMVHGAGIGATLPDIKFQGVTLKSYKPSGDNYLFIDLELSKQVVPGQFTIDFVKDGKAVANCRYELKKRDPDKGKKAGFNTADAIYLLMPDRFSNGNPANDNVTGMSEQADRKNLDGRHGGDLVGISNHLDYIKDLGFTTVWINPVLENNMPKYSYHGYAITDYYKVDPRYGTNAEYVALIQKAHNMGLKVVMDMVFNHCGSGHWWMNDMPATDWVHQWPEFTRSNYRGGVVTDPYASDYDSRKMLDGWFDVTMPDLNQQNSQMANYLIQNSIWWIEFSALDGIRQDTYPYADAAFMSEWMKRVLEEYPKFKIVGEVWLSNPSQVAWWLHNSGMKNRDGKEPSYESNLTNAFDFPLTFALQQAVTEEDGWSNGMAKLYEVLSQDFLYSKPEDLITFADNHDIDRMASKLKTPENVRMAMAFLCTTRGFPLFYYGSEIMMKGWADEGHGTIRRDFPGGWAGDSTDIFSKSNLTKEQSATYDYLKTLLNWRKSNATVQKGNLTHYIPENGIYVYFRKLGKAAVMVIMNNNKDAKNVDMARFNGDLKGFVKGYDVMAKGKLPDLKNISIDGKTARIIELSE